MLAFGALLHLVVDGIQVGFSLPSPLNGDEPAFLQFGDEFSHSRSTHAHVFGQSLLAWEAVVVVPGVADEHCVHDLAAYRNIGTPQNEIRDLGESVLRNRIRSI